MLSGYSRNAAIGFGIAALRACFANGSMLSLPSVNDFNAGGLRTFKMSNLDRLIMNLVSALGTREPA